MHGTRIRRYLFFQVAYLQITLNLRLFIKIEQQLSYHLLQFFFGIDPFDSQHNLFFLQRVLDAWIKEGILRMTTALPSAERTTGRALYTWPKPAMESS